jgi:CRP-like cAMP-binding protein
MMDLSVLLGQSEFFRSLDPGHRKQLEEICLARSLNKRELLFLEGDRGHALFLCARGAIQLYRQSPDGQEVVIKVIRPGELFAEAILFEQDTYPVSAVALEPSLVYMLPKMQFDCLLQEADFRNDFMTSLMKKLRYLTEQVQYLTACDVEARLFLFLRNQYPGKRAFKIGLSKKDVAAAIATTPETLSRLLLRLKREGKLSWDGRQIEIFNSN